MKLLSIFLAFLKPESPMVKIDMHNALAGERPEVEFDDLAPWISGRDEKGTNQPSPKSERECLLKKTIVLPLLLIVHFSHDSFIQLSQPPRWLADHPHRTTP